MYRVSAAVLFTDIVSPTERLSARGDAHWRHELDVHDRLVDRLLSKFGGRRAKHTGGGVFALCDGPTKAARCRLGSGLRFESLGAQQLKGFAEETEVFRVSKPKGVAF